MGLTLTREFCKLLNAELELKSEAGKGTDVLVSYYNTPAMDEHTPEKLFEEQPVKGDDEQLFSETEDKSEDKPPTREFIGPPWKIMVVDDEADIHSVTRIALKSFSYQDRGIEFIHAHSAEESKPLLKKHKDIAVILLDVVMETNTAGLDLVKYIRDGLKYKYTQIILRTGYPGYAPEREVIVSYEINDYKTKTELTSFKLFTLILASLRAYNSVTELEMLRLGLEDKVIERTAELEQKNLQIMEMDQMKTRFFNNISHEFRTPLTLILGPLEDILAKEEMKERNRVTMERMQRSATRLLALVNQLLDLAKLDAGSLKLELVESDIMRFLRLLGTSFNHLAERKNITYKLIVPDKEFKIPFDQDKIEKIAFNLLSNAFKFTPEKGTVTCEVELLLDNKNNFLKLLVKDTGPGISPVMINKIFDRFYQVESGQGMRAGGTGIGLSLTKELIQLQHGDIKVESKPDSGSQFKVTIPLGYKHLSKGEYVLKKEHEFNDSFVTTYAVLSGLCPETKGNNNNDEKENGQDIILVVEDSADVRSHLCEGLGGQYIIKEAENGKKGFEVAVESIPDLIITDLMMPEMDGVEMCKKLKTDERTSHIPLIMLTSRANVESRIEGLETGADDYLTKPFNMQELTARIQNLVMQRKALRERFSKEAELGPKDISVTSADEKFLNKAIGIIEENLDDCDFDVTVMTSHIGMSRMQLFRKLKALTNQTPSEFIRTIRLKRAASLIRQKFGNVAEITYEVGFNNLSYFAKCFKEMYGKSPSEFAKDFA